MRCLGKFKRIFTLFLSIVFVLLLMLGCYNKANAGAEKSSPAVSIKVLVEGKKVTFPKPPTTVSKEIIVPAEALVKAMGASYKYNTKAKTISIKKSKIKIELKIDSKTVTVNGNKSLMAVSPKLINIPFVPVKFISGKLGYSQYRYDSNNKTVYLSIPSQKVHIFIAGDSTAAKYDSYQYPLTGWGQVINQYFNNNVIVYDYALSGASSKSFYNSGNWEVISNELKAGDYVFISFGHNDEKSDPNLYTDPNTTYKTYLERYINYIRVKKATTVLITPVARRMFNQDGKIINTHGSYPDAMKDVGRLFKVPVVDLTADSAALFESLGVEKTKEIFLWQNPGQSPNYPNGVQDNTHFQENGANEIAKLIINGLKTVGDSKLKSMIK